MTIKKVTGKLLSIAIVAWALSLLYRLQLAKDDVARLIEDREWLQSNIAYGDTAMDALAKDIRDIAEQIPEGYYSKKSLIERVARLAKDKQRYANTIQQLRQDYEGLEVVGKRYQAMVDRLTKSYETTREDYKLADQHNHRMYIELLTAYKRSFGFDPTQEDWYGAENRSKWKGKVGKEAPLTEEQMIDMGLQDIPKKHVGELSGTELSQAMRYMGKYGNATQPGTPSDEPRGSSPVGEVYKSSKREGGE